MPYSQDPQAQLNLTGTGAQTAIIVEPGAFVSMGINVGTGDDVDLEIQLKDGGNWFKLVENITSATVKTNVGPIHACRLNIITNTTGTIDFEVVQAHM